MEQKDGVIELHRCPVCGRKPKVYRDYGYEQACFGAWCKIQCKRLFCKTHMKVEAGKSMWIRAYADAAKRWNELCEEMEK